MLHLLQVALNYGQTTKPIELQGISAKQTALNDDETTQDLKEVKGRKTMNFRKYYE